MTKKRILVEIDKVVVIPCLEDVTIHFCNNSTSGYYVGKKRTLYSIAKEVDKQCYAGGWICKNINVTDEAAEAEIHTYFKGRCCH